MRTRAILAAALLATITLSGCTLARQVTTRKFDFTQNLIPTRNHGDKYDTGFSDTGGPIGPLPFDIVITGDVRDKYDKYHGGVDYAYLTYKAHTTATAPVRVRLWATLGTSVGDCPPVVNGQVPEQAQVILDVTIPANGLVDNESTKPFNTEELRKIVEALLMQPNNSAACVYVEADCPDDPAGNVEVTDLNVLGRAHGSLF
ncbi:MAG TPA: hypothetical protein VGM51_12185 [Armatimonadota bacterium]|jgi:hypothetical protein